MVGVVGTVIAVAIDVSLLLAAALVAAALWSVARGGRR